eukprot:349632-Chlamydomonas_euryale.AAC.9
MPVCVAQQAVRMLKVLTAEDSPSNACVAHLIHLFACFCGSMNSGHRRAVVAMMALSMENESLGRPAMTHSRMRT